MIFFTIEEFRAIIKKGEIMKTIKEIQKIIEENDCVEYYHEYKKHEKRYWGAIPEWILECKNIQRVADIGIAYGSLGLFTALNHNANLIGVDNRKYISDKLVERYNIGYIPANIELDNFEHMNDMFDLILYTECIEHMNFNPIPTLIKIKNMLKDDGVLFLSTPSDKYWGRLHYYKDWKGIPYPNCNTEIKDCHIFQYNLEEITELFDTVGLKIEKYAESGEIPYVHMCFKLVKA